MSPAFRISCASGKDLSDFCSSKPTCKYATSWDLAVGGEAAGHPGGTGAPAALLRADGASVVPGRLQICEPPDSGQMGAWSRVERAWQAPSGKHGSRTGPCAWGDPRAPARGWARSWDFQSHAWQVFCVMMGTLGAQPSNLCFSSQLPNSAKDCFVGKGLLYRVYLTVKVPRQDWPILFAR